MESPLEQLQARRRKSDCPRIAAGYRRTRMLHSCRNVDSCTPRGMGASPRSPLPLPCADAQSRSGLRRHLRLRRATRRAELGAEPAHAARPRGAGRPGLPRFRRPAHQADRRHAPLRFRLAHRRRPLRGRAARAGGALRRRGPRGGAPRHPRRNPARRGAAGEGRRLRRAGQHRGAHRGAGRPGRSALRRSRLALDEPRRGARRGQRGAQTEGRPRGGAHLPAGGIAAATARRGAAARSGQAGGEQRSPPPPARGVPRRLPLSRGGVALRPRPRARLRRRRPRRDGGGGGGLLRAGAPGSAAVSTARNLVLLLSDMKGFTARTSRQTREENERMLALHDALLLPVVRGFGGRKVKAIGDALLAAFESPTDAVLCAMALQDRLAAFNDAAEEKERIEVRVSLSQGEVRLQKGDVHGEAVQLALQAGALADAGEVVLTDAVYLSMNKSEAPTEILCERPLQGGGATKLRRALRSSDARVPYGGRALARLGRLPDPSRRVQLARLIDRVASFARRRIVWAAAGLLLVAAAAGGRGARGRAGRPPRAGGPGAVAAALPARGGAVR